MFAITRGRLAVAALGLSAAVASAQDPPTLVYGPVVGCPWGHCAAANHGTYGPALFASNPKGHSKLLGPDEPSCIGRSSYPLSDWHYIRQFCGPTLHPGTCYGYYPTKWRKWEETCPGGVCGTAAGGPDVLLAPAPIMAAPPGPITPLTPSEQLPPPKEDKPKDPPKTDGPKVDPVTPPKVPLIPKDTGTLPSPLPTVPIVPVPMPNPTEPGKINTTEATMPVPPSTVVPPSPEPRVVVPPKGN